MIAMTTSNSVKVNAFDLFIINSVNGRRKVSNRCEYGRKTGDR